MPFFSIIIPTYNRAIEIVKTLDSVVSQTFNDFEIIVIDDFSTDDTELTIKELNIPNLIFIKNQRKKGACGARNTGCEIANGEWLAFLDSDDLWENNKLELFFQMIKKTKFKAIYSGYIRIKNGNKVSFVEDYSKSLLPNIYKHNIVKGLSLFAVERKTFYLIGGFDEDLMSKQDLDLYVRLLKKNKFGYVKKGLTIFINTSSGRISDNKKSRLFGWIKFYSKHCSDMTNDIRIFNLKCIVYNSFIQKKYTLTIKYSFLYVLFLLKGFCFKRPILSNL